MVLGKYLLAVLPTGFWKTLMFHVFILIKRSFDGKPSSVVVACPLRGIVYDQME